MGATRGPHSAAGQGGRAGGKQADGCILPGLGPYQLSMTRQESGEAAGLVRHWEGDERRHKGGKGRRKDGNIEGA